MLQAGLTLPLTIVSRGFLRPALALMKTRSLARPTRRLSPIGRHGSASRGCLPAKSPPAAASCSAKTAAAASASADKLLGDRGITPGDTLTQLRVLSKSGLFDFFDLSIGSSHHQHHTIASMAVPEGFALPFAAQAKEVVKGSAAIFVAGRITDPYMAGRAVAQGRADVIGMARALLWRESSDRAVLIRPTDFAYPEMAKSFNVYLRRSADWQIYRRHLDPSTIEKHASLQLWTYKPLGEEER